MFEFQKLIDCERETGDSAEVFAVQEPLVSVTRKRDRKQNQMMSMIDME